MRLRFGWIGRRDRPPAALVARLGADDRLVSWAPLVDGGALLASRFGLWWPAPDGQRRIPWERIDKATWSDGSLQVVEADLVDDLLLVDRAPVVARLAEQRDLPLTVRKRVQGSVVSSELVSGDGVSMRVVGRRIPGRDGVTWWARLEPGVEDNEHTRAVVHEVLDARRAQQSLSDASR